MIEFKDFDFDDNARYKEYLGRCIQIISNASPVVLLSNKEKLNIRRSFAAKLFWHTFTIDGEELLGPPAGDWDEINWREVFAEHVPAGTVFYFVPEYLVKLWQRELGAAIKIEESRDMWDYILHIDRMEKIEGNKLKSFRKGRNAFEKNYEYTVEDITPKIFDELRAFQSAAEKNLQHRVKNVDTAQEDDEAFNFALENWDKLGNLFGFVVRVDGQIVAYLIDEQINETYSIGLLAKANYEIKGVNQFAYWYDAKINRERGIVTQNIMDDAGEEHLRFFKEHLYPLTMLKKYVVVYMPEDAETLPITQTREEHGLKISFERLKKSLTVAMSGKLNTDAANWAKNNILSALDGAQEVVFDLNGLEYISSSGLRILIAALKKIRAQGGNMTIKNVGEQVKEVLDMTGFAQIFNVEA
ncbi:MAG: anti-sigma factor antagonist [Selenomonadaceae bacterium]|nr:anti-sigma factor antagonist [Selenomonadaceae bacterium]